MNLSEFTVIATTNHWQVRGTIFYRDCHVRLNDGTTAIVGIRDDLLGDQA